MTGSLLHNPNAWVETVQDLAATLEQVYAHTTGEIWLFNNDLKVFRDSKAFNLLYKKMIDGTVAKQVVSVKILLNRNRHKEFFRQNGPILNNLAKLRPNRIRTFYVGCTDDVQPCIPDELGNSDPWIFYLGHNYLRSNTGFVIYRPNTYPFVTDKDALDNVALGWQTARERVEVFQQRLAMNPWFEDVFVKGVEENFQSLEPVVTNRKIDRINSVGCRAAHEVSDIHSKLRVRRLDRLPVAQPVDVGILTTLVDESRAVREQFELRQNSRGAYEGRIMVGTRSLSVVNVQLSKPGSVAGSIAANRLIREWNPRIVFLVGRCGGWREDTKNGIENSMQTQKHNREEQDIIEGDVVVATEICAYEYQTMKKQEGEYRLDYDVRSVHVSSKLLEVSSALIAENWEYSGEGYPRNWGTKRRCKAILGQYACGSKVVKVGNEWFEEIRKALGKKKITATEMEGEGVGAVMEMEDPPIPFLLVKGISDFADEDKTDKFNALSNNASARFIRDMLSRPDLIGILDRSHQLRLHKK